MKRWIPTTLAVLAAAGLTHTAMGRTGLRVGREIRYPTEWDQQISTDEHGNRVITATPRRFETRREGVSVNAPDNIGVVRHTKRIQGRLAYLVRFNNGQEAVLVDGYETEVQGTRFRGLGRRADGSYAARNMETREIVTFRVER